MPISCFPKYTQTSRLSKSTLMFLLGIGSFVLLPLSSNAQQYKLPWLDSIGPSESVSSIQTLATCADVKVSDGLRYSTETVFHDPQRAVFKRRYSDRIVTQGLEGRYVWSNSGDGESELSTDMGDFILGHQFHAQILFYDRLHQGLSKPESTSFQGSSAFVVKSDSGQTSFYYNESGPLGLQIQRLPSDPVTHPIVFTFEDWRNVEDFRLPFRVLIDDGEREFTYSFSAIVFNERSVDEYRR